MVIYYYIMAKNKIKINKIKIDKKIKKRSPVVVIMGHIDHGKSTLLDYIRKTNIVDAEAGGITQHLAAYEVGEDNSKITFIDTPGHEAFAATRSRGANIADIAILVVSAEDGVKEQTIGALKFIKESKIPFLVAINKIDAQGADIERTKMSLLEKEVYLEGMGGDITYVPISAKTGEGIDELLEAVRLINEFEELEGDESEKASGYVLEAFKDEKRGLSATLLIKNGSIKKGDFVVASKSIAPVRIMENVNGVALKEASFSKPINIVGFDILPKAGDSFSVFINKKEAQKYIEELKEIEEEIKKTKNTRINRKTRGSRKNLFPIIIKTDVTGSLEAVKHLLSDIKLKKSEYKIISEGVGDISDTDLKKAAGDRNTTIIGFNVKITRTAKSIAEVFGMDIKTSDIIYRLTEYLEARIKTLTPKNTEEEISGEAKILKIFSESNKGSVVGAEVFNGVIEKTDRLRIVRREQLVGEARILELQQSKKNVSEVTQGQQFGIMLSSKLDVAPGDMIIAIKIVEK